MKRRNLNAFGEKLKKNNISTYQIAKDLNIHVPVIYNWTTGVCKPNVYHTTYKRVVVLLRDKYGVNVEFNDFL